MKARLVDIKPLAVHDGRGIRTTVFFKGCSLKCLWCHNPESIGFGPQLGYYENKCLGCMECVIACPQGAHKNETGIHVLDRALCTGCGSCEEACLGEALKLYGREVTLEALLVQLLRDREFYENSGGGVTLSGGECLCQADFCRALLKELNAQGIHTAVDTCGFVPRSAFEKVIPYTDVFLYDLKAYDEDVHIACTGQSNRLILENLQYLDSLGKEIQIRIPYVPGHNDSQMEKLAAFVRGLRHVTQVEVLAYHNFAGSKYAAVAMPNTMPPVLPEAAALQKARKLFA